MVNLANELHVRGQYDVQFLLLRKEGTYLDIIHPEISVEGLSEAGDVLLTLPKLIKAIKREKPDLLLSSLPITDLMAIFACALLGRNAPKHIACTQNMREDEFQSYKTIRSKIRSKMMLIFYKKADYFAAVSRAVGQELENFFKVTARKIQVIPNSLDLDHVRAQKDVTTDHPWLQKGKDYKTLIAVGRLVEQKDYPLLLSAFAILKKDIAVKLIILGEGPERAKIESLRDELGLKEHVDMPGFKENPFSLVAAADAFVLSSAWEGFGNVIIEALSVGTPVVATNCPGAPSEILNDGEFGTLAPVKKPEKLAEAIQTVLDGHHPTKKVLMDRASEYSIKNVSDQYQTYFERVLHGQ